MRCFNEPSLPDGTLKPFDLLPFAEIWLDVLAMDAAVILHPPIAVVADDANLMASIAAWLSINDCATAERTGSLPPTSKLFEIIVFCWEMVAAAATGAGPITIGACGDRTVDACDGADDGGGGPKYELKGSTCDGMYVGRLWCIELASGCAPYNPGDLQIWQIQVWELDVCDGKTVCALYRYA